MNRATVLLSVLGLSVALAGCSPNSCESIKERLGEIERDIEDNPDLVLDDDTGKEIEELGNKMVELQCFG